jgi:hypothetical protein
MAILLLISIELGADICAFHFIIPFFDGLSMQIIDLFLHFLDGILRRLASERAVCFSRQHSCRCNGGEQRREKEKALLKTKLCKLI